MNEDWTLWKVDDAQRKRAVVRRHGSRGELLKEADRLNENPQPSPFRYIAMPGGETPDFRAEAPALNEERAAAVPVASPPRPKIKHQWRCDLADTAPLKMCTPLMPHGPAYNCGYWYAIQLPSNLVTDDLIKLTAKLLRIGALTSGNVSRRPPAY